MSKRNSTKKKAPILHLAPKPSRNTPDASTLKLTRDVYEMAQRGELEGVICLTIKGDPNENNYLSSGKAMCRATALLYVEDLKRCILDRAEEEGLI